MNFVPLFIGLRYTRAKRRNQFISFLSGFSLLGMLLGVLALMVVLSVMNGFDRELKGRLLNAIAHGSVYRDGGLADWPALQARLAAEPELLGSAPYVAGFAMAGHGRGLQSVELRGIDPQWEQQISALGSHMLTGSLEDLRPGSYGIVIGRLLARQLDLVPGDQLLLTLPSLNVTPAGIFPRLRRFTVLGVFEVGAQVDQSLALINLRDAQRLLRRGDRVDGLHVRVADLYQAGDILARLAPRLPEGLSVQDWSQTQGSLFQAVKMEKTVITVLLLIIVLVAAFNIVTSLVLMVADKRADIAVLRTLGLTPAQVMAIFVVQGSAVGAVGVLLGGLLGSLLGIYIGPLVHWLETATGVYLFDPSVYFISYLPSHWQLSDLLLVCGVALSLSLVASLYPAYRAARVAPAEALRYE